MKRTFTGTAMFALVLAIAGLAQSTPAAPATAAAAPAGGVKVGIIDIQQAIIGTNEGGAGFRSPAKEI